MNTKKTATVAVLAAILCILSPFSIPLGAIPVSLATFAVYIISCTVSKKYATAAVIIFILLGAAGLPVFSAFSGGFHRIAGVTGGYIIGYIPCAFIISFLVDKFESKKFIYPLSMILGTLACYAIGTVWYIYQTGTAFISALTTCVFPFIIADTVKIAAATCIGMTARKKLRRFIL